MSLSSLVIPPSLDRAQALRIRRFALAAVVYALSAVQVAILWAFGVFPASAAPGLAASAIAANVALYWVLRSGFNLRFKDPSFTRVQMLIAIAFLMYILYHMDDGRNVALFGCFFVLLFGIYRLDARDFTLVTLFTLAAYALVIYLLMTLRPEAIRDVRLEWLSWVILACWLPLFNFTAGQISTLRRRVRESEERWKFAIEGSGDGVWDWNLQTGGATFSRRWKEMLGFSEGEIANHSDEWIKRTHEEDLPGVMARIQEHLDGKTTAAVAEFRMRTKDGGLIWILGRGMVVSRDAEGKPTRLVGTNTDITDRMRVEIALRESEKRLSAVFQASPIAIVVSRIADGKIVDGNDAAMKLYGIARDEAIGRTVAELGTYVNLAQREEMVKRLREHGSVERFPLDFRRRGGEVGLLEVSGRVIKLNGEPSLVTLLVDVTERDRVEEELRRTIAFADSMSEAMPLPVFHKDAEGRYTGCNSAFARFVGKTKDEIVGKTVFEVSPQQFAQTYRDKDLELLNAPVGSQTYESSVQHMDGTVHEVIFHKARLMDSGGNPTGIVGVITDITGLKQIHARQLSLEAQLRESQKMEALGTLAGGVAHDFNNIVAAIIGNTELASQDVGSGHAALESLNEIRKASGRAKELVQQILAFGRRQGLTRKAIALAPLVEESARLLRATMLGPVTLSVECLADTPTILADPTQIQQVLLNLCNNALHAVEDQGRVGVIEIRAGKAMRDGMPCASLMVRDNGHGMDEATRNRIFEPFFTTKAVGKGTGLGLAVVHSILKDHEASMEVSSAPGEGTSFIIHFPATRASEHVIPNQRPAGAPVEGHGKRVLYVDDDESIVFLVTRLLERQGYHVSGYTSPKEALAAVRANPSAFDLAVTDYSMPGMSGLDVAFALKEIRPDLPIAVASGYITDDLRQNAPAAGVSELIYKPDTAEDLCEVVARLAQTVQRHSRSS